MGKQVQGASAQRPQLVVRTASCPEPSDPLSRASLKDSEGNFSLLLTSLHQQVSNPQSQSQLMRNLPVAQVADLINFFNNQKYYSRIELDCYVICLANLITLTNPPSPLIVTSQFKAKIRKFLQELSEEDSNTSTYSNKVQAVFYILAVIIYQERSAKKNDGKKCIRSIIADKGIMRAFLDITIPNNTRISKFYGIIMVAITTRNHQKIIREIIVKSILLNIARVDHQSSLFNLLVYLRSEKNKIRISLNDLRQGGVAKVLIEGYQKYIEQYQSFYMLDYLNHILGLFPSLAESAVPTDFIVLLVRHLGLRNMHHPMHETTILGFINRGLKWLDERKRQALVNALYSLEPTDIFTQGKIAKLLVEHDTSLGLLNRVIEHDFFMDLVNSIHENLERNVLSSIVELLLSAIIKIKQLNGHVSRHMIWILRKKLAHIDGFQLKNEVQAMHE